MLSHHSGVEVINVLVKAGANRTLRDAYGKTAAEAASKAGRHDCVSALNLEMADKKVNATTVCAFTTGGLQRARRMHSCSDGIVSSN